MLKLYTNIFLFLLLFSGVFAQDSAQAQIPLTGFVDMHAHPRDDLAFGTQLFYGAPYGNIEEALGNCKEDHGKNLMRSVLAAQTEQQNNSGWKDGKEGYPDFATWPAWCTTLHQQMWIDWIERAHKGGLNIMVALAVSSHIMASAAKSEGPNDDGQVLLNCIQGIKDLVAHSTFMEVALSPQDVRRIVSNGKLAVILGSEMDNIGNFYFPADYYKANFNPSPSNQEIKQELDKLWDLGVRYIFPVHLNNTIFGGSALLFSTLNVANKFATGAEFIPEQVSTKETGIGFRLQHPAFGLNTMAKMFMPFLLPAYINPARKVNYTSWDTLTGFGHRNSLGITERGKFGLNYMMQKGFMIDIDHMSEKMVNEVLQMAVANDYPVNSGHNVLRGESDNENSRTIRQYQQLKQIGGMVGLQHCDSASGFVKAYREVVEIMGYTHMAFGSDAGGFKALPKPDTTIRVVYDSTFTRCKTGNRTWDINTDGVAHYGLLPDYIRGWEAAGMTPQDKNVFMSSAEDFTRMWEKCELRKANPLK